MLIKNFNIIPILIAIFAGFAAAEGALSYGRGVGFVSEAECNQDKDSIQGCEKCMALYFPKCKDGFKTMGCNICVPDKAKK